MERRTKYLIRISTGRDLSFHHCRQEGVCPYLVQIPPRAFSHRSSSHVLAYEDLALSDPAYIRSEWYSCLLEYFTLGGPLTSAHMAHLFFIIYRPVTNLLYFWSMVGRVGLEPTLPYGPDLQSGEVPTTLYRPKYN